MRRIYQVGRTCRYRLSFEISNGTSVIELRDFSVIYDAALAKRPALYGMGILELVGAYARLQHELSSLLVNCKLESLRY